MDPWEVFAFIAGWLIVLVMVVIVIIVVLVVVKVVILIFTSKGKGKRKEEYKLIPEYDELLSSAVDEANGMFLAGDYLSEEQIESFIKGARYMLDQVFQAGVLEKNRDHSI